MPAVDTTGHRVRRHVRIMGLVQGVYFRASVAERARGLGLDGWVRNLQDGSVEAAFEGDPKSVQLMIDFCRRGPSSARVEELRVDEEPTTGMRGFTVR